MKHNYAPECEGCASRGGDAKGAPTKSKLKNLTNVFYSQLFFLLFAAAMKIMKILQAGGVSHGRSRAGGGKGCKRAATLDKFKQMAGGSP